MRNNSTEILLQGLEILIVDGNAYMRRLTRAMLLNLGAKSVMEAADGLAALEAIRTCDPDVMLLDWDMPVLSGMEVMRIVRSPGVFPRPNLPIIMLTNRAHRTSVCQAMRAGVHEFLLKPTSHATHCPYKGDANYFSIEADGRSADNAVWSYEQPFPAMAEIAGYLAFYLNRVDKIEECAT